MRAKMTPEMVNILASLQKQKQAADSNMLEFLRISARSLRLDPDLWNFLPATCEFELIQVKDTTPK
jgi:hypothetical protein